MTDLIVLKSVKSWFQDILLCEKVRICDTLSFMECDKYENKYIDEKIFTVL